MENDTNNQKPVAVTAAAINTPPQNQKDLIANKMDPKKEENLVTTTAAENENEIDEHDEQDNEQDNLQNQQKDENKMDPKEKDNSTKEHRQTRRHNEHRHDDRRRNDRDRHNDRRSRRDNDNSRHHNRRRNERDDRDHHREHHGTLNMVFMFEKSISLCQLFVIIVKMPWFISSY